MASVTLTLSARTSKDSGKAEVLLRYRNTREVALRAHTHTYILPKFFSEGRILIKNRIITDEVREAQEAKAQVDRIVNHILEKGNDKPTHDFTRDWAQDTIDRLLFPENYRQAEGDEVYFFDKFDKFLKYKKISPARKKTYVAIFNIIRRYELYAGRPINLDKATADTFVYAEGRIMLMI